MSTIPLVTAIIIFLNGEAFIEEAIQSVIDQTYSQWELLLVDDGSTDGSTEVAQKYALEHPDKIRYLEHDQHRNRGMSASRNLGIVHANGEFIAFLDSDDIWLPKKLEKQLGLFEKNPDAAIVCGPTQWWYSWTGNPTDKALDSMREITREYDRLFQPPVLLKHLLLDKARTPATCSVLIRRELFEETGLFEEQFKTMYEDQAFFSKVYLKANVYISSQYWDLYRQHSANCCFVSEKTGQGSPGHFNPAHKKFLEWLRQYLFNEDLEDPELLTIIEKLLWAYDHQILFYLQNPERLLRMIGRVTLPPKIRQWLWNRYAPIKDMDL